MRIKLRKYIESYINNLNIKRKLTYMYLITFIIPIILIIIIISVGIYNTLKDWETRQTENLLEQTMRAFSDTLENAANLSDRIYINENIQDILLNNYDNAGSIYKDYQKLSFMEEFLQAYREIRSIRVYSTNQTILDSSFLLKADTEILKSNWFRQAVYLRGKLFWIKKEDSVNKKEHLSLVRSINRLSDKKFVGVLSVNVNTDRIDGILRSTNVPTLFVLNGEPLFGSFEGWENLDTFFLTKRVLDEQSLVILRNIKINGENSAVFINSFRPYRCLRDKVHIVQIVPMKTLSIATGKIVRFCVIIATVVFALSFSLIFLFSKYFGKRVNIVKSEIEKVAEENFEIVESISGTDEFSQIHDALYKTTTTIKKLITEVYQRRMEQEQLLSRQNDIRFKMLASQINPHFLFNTLETIRMQALSTKDKQVANTIKLLAKLLRHNLETNSQPVSLVDELDAVTSYLDIQHLRFGARITYDIICLCDIRDIKILPLLIQPIVENSFVHGLESKVDGGFIYITILTEIRNDLPCLIIKVQDNGEGIPLKRLEEIYSKLNLATIDTIGTSIGMMNVNQRIKIFYGEQYGLEIQSKVNEGTTIFIVIPL